MPPCIQAINKLIIYTFIINTMTFQQINYIHYKYNYISTNQLYVYIYKRKESARGILNQNNVCVFLISKDFIMNMDTFLISILFSVVISSINVGIFNLNSRYKRAFK